MTYVDPAAPPNVGEIPAAFRYIQWGPVIAGALLAAALASVLHTFAAAIGLSMSSTAPTWRDTSFVLVLLSGLYLLLVAFVSYGLGGYVAGRLRSRLTGGAAPTRSNFATACTACWSGRSRPCWPACWHWAPHKP